MAEAQATYDKALRAKEIAKLTLTHAVGAVVRDTLRRRAEAVDEYETAITFIGDIPAN